MIMDEAGSSENGGFRTPRDVNLVPFVKRHIGQIAELISIVERKGQTKKGCRTAQQRLPRHMRRRAMSYNVKRMPRQKRRFMQAFVSVTKHRNKAPCRFWRRRPRNLFLNYTRRQQQKAWLETHVWHAKRFRMVEKWGYKIPYRSYHRAFRPTYRDSVHRCVVRDVSYLNCFQIYCMDRNVIINKLNTLCVPSVGLTFASKSAANGSFELPVLLYETGEYPCGFIAVVRFMWFRTSEGESVLTIWSHPANSATLLEKFVNIFGLMKEPASRISEVDGVLRNMKKWRLYRERISQVVYRGEDKVKLFDLKNQLIRLRLHGPNSFFVVANALSTVKERDFKEDWMEGYRSWNEIWKNDISKRSPSELPDGYVISLLISSSRFRPPYKGKKPSQLSHHCESFNCFALPEPRTELWDYNVRLQVLRQRLNEAVSRRKERVAPLSNETLTTEIPVLLIVRSGNVGTEKTHGGIDIVAPTGFGMDIWLALQYNKAHSAGLRDQKFFEFESGRLNFPIDIPDCEAGRAEQARRSIRLEEKYLGRPYNRRIKYWANLSIKYPFTFQFTELARDWLNIPCSSTAYVIRDRRTLAQIAKWIEQKGPEPEGSLLNSLALVPVLLLAVSRGRPCRFATICAPVDGDLSCFTCKSKCAETVNIVQLPRIVKPTSDITTIENERTMIDGFIPLAGENREAHVALNQLFPDNEFLREQKRKSKRKLRREVIKKRRLSNSGQNQSCYSNDMVALEMQSTVPYRDSSAREIIGRIVRGDYSLSAGRGRAIGYCCLAALKSISMGRVLFRNASSKYYHPATVTVLMSGLDL